MFESGSGIVYIQMLERIMVIIPRIALLYFCLYVCSGCSQKKQYEQLNGTWHLIADKYNPYDTIDFPDYSDRKVRILTIKTDSGFSDHLYRNDSLILIDNGERVDLMRISQLRGLITFQKKP